MRIPRGMCPWRRPDRAACLALGGLVLLWAPGARAEVRRMEAVGAVPIAGDEVSGVPPRKAALDKALADAVRRVALEHVDPEALGPAGPSVLDDALGRDPRSYTDRFRILEDRGERPALFVEDPGVLSEYVVVVEVFVDSDRVREALQERGLPLLSAGRSPRTRVRLEVVDLDSYAAFAALREALVEGVGVHSVVPVEMERGRAVLAVDSDRDPSELLRKLLEAVPPELSVDPVLSQGEGLTVRVRLRPPDQDAGFPPAAPRD